MPRNSLWCFCLWLCLYLCLPAWSLTARDQAQRLDQADALLHQAMQHPETAAPFVQRAATLVPAEASPRLRQAAAAPTTGNLARARQEVATLRQAARLTPAPGGTAEARGHAALQTVLARPEFQPLEKLKVRWSAKSPTWWQGFLRHWNAFWHNVARAIGRLFSRIGNAIGRFFRWVAAHLPHIKTQPKSTAHLGWLSGLGAVARLVLLVVLIAALLFLFALLVSRLLAWWRHREAPEDRHGLTDGGAPVNRKQEPSFWERSLAQAIELWGRGESREALRLLHRACLVLLDARGVLRYDESRANGEILRELRRQGPSGVYEAFRPIVRTFDRSWYGCLSVSSDEFSAALEAGQRFREQVVKEL